MSLIPFHPSYDIDPFFDEEDWFSSSLEKPAMDLYETDKEVVATIQLPGIDPEKIHVDIEDGFLVVEGSHEKTEEQGGKEKGYWKKEIHSGSFQRVARLPRDIDEKTVSAEYEKGLLTVTLGKKKEKKDSKKIKVKVKGK